MDAETQSSDEWYTRDLSEDLDSLASARCALVRVFVSWRVLEPQVGQYAEEPLQRLSAIIEAARSRKMQTVVCFFADDRHAELTEVTWAKKRDPRTDGYLIQREVALVQKVVGLLRADPGVFAWQLGNEAFLSGFETAEELDTWVETLREAIRELDPSHPIGLGADGETLYRATGVDARASLDSCEFSVTHSTAAYRAYAAEGPITSGPSTYLDSFLLRNAHRGRPVLMDEVGVMALDMSADEEARYVRSVLWGGFINRAGGVMARRLRDMDTERREPYFTDPFETLVGIADSEGIAKPVAGEITKFVRTVARIDLRSVAPLAERTAVLVPAERYEPLPSLAGLYDPRACLQSFIAAKQAHVPVTVIHEEDPYEEYQVLVVPSVFELADETWERVTAFVQSGGSLLLSYGGGDAHPAVRDLCGVEFLGDGGPQHSLSCRVAQPDILGALESFDVRFDVPNYALLSGGTATIVATDAKGSPLLTVNQVGQGRAVYVAAPLERAVAQGDPWATPLPVRTLMREVYGAVARAAGCGAPIECSEPDVEVALFQGETEDVVVLLNHSDVKLSASLQTDRRVASIADVRGGAQVAVGGTVFSAPLEANGASAFRLTYA
jgi:endo-1,4-beta-mannosidase